MNAPNHSPLAFPARWLASTMGRLARTAALTAVTALAACGGGDEVRTLSGVAATGAPIAGGTVDVACAGGAPLQATTSNAGTWLVTLSGQTLPCKVRVSGGGLPTGMAYHSFAIGLGTVNVTPLTDLVVARLAGAAPSVWFDQRAAADFNALTTAAANVAITAVRDALSGVTGLSGWGSFNPIATAFAALPTDPFDKLLEALKAAFPNYPALLAAAQAQGFSSAAVQTLLASGGGSGGGGSGGTGGGTGGGSISASLASASSYAIGYAGGLCSSTVNCVVGLDTRPATITLGASGELTGYTNTRNPSSEALTLGSALVSDLGGNADLTWGRWNGGTPGGTYYGMPFAAGSLRPNNGFHYVVGRNTTTLPTSGFVAYTAIAATRPTATTAADWPTPGSVNLADSKLAIDFSSGKVGFDLTFSYTDNPVYKDIRLASVGGATDVASSAFAFGADFSPTTAAYAVGANTIKISADGVDLSSQWGANSFAYVVPFGDNATYVAVIFHDYNRNAGVVIFSRN